MNKAGAYYRYHDLSTKSIGKVNLMQFLFKEPCATVKIQVEKQRLTKL
jgi:hypothetical protein